MWLEEAVGGTDMSEPVVLYNTQRDDDPSAQTLLSQLNDRVISRDAHGGIKEMVVLVAQLSTGKVVVGTSSAMWRRADGDNGERAWDDIVAIAAKKPVGFVTTAHRVLVRSRDDAFNAFLEYYSSAVREVGEYYDGLLSAETTWEEKWAGMVSSLVNEEDL